MIKKVISSLLRPLSRLAPNVMLPRGYNFFFLTEDFVNIVFNYFPLIILGKKYFRLHYKTFLSTKDEYQSYSSLIVNKEFSSEF
jgi:hypothetical protein